MIREDTDMAKKIIHQSHESQEGADVELFKKISPDTDEPEISTQQTMKKKKSRKKILLVFLGFFIFLLITVGILAGVGWYKVGVPVQKLIAQGKKTEVAARGLADAIKGQNLDETKNKLAEVRAELTQTKTLYQDLLWLKSFPTVGLYIEDGEHAFNAAFAGLDVGDKAIAALEPNADLLGLKGESNFVSGSADERIQLAVKTMQALIPQINAMAKDFEVLGKELDAIDPQRYPEEFQGIAVRSQMIAMKGTIENASTLFVNAQPLLINLPSILGEPKDKRYLVLFQNDKELRPTGGFLTAFAQFRFEHGKAILERSDDIYKLDDALRKKYPAPEEILTYHKNVNQLHIRDSNLSPDFKLSMQQFMEMYENTAGKEKIDGIIAMDTHAVVEALKILGPIHVSGRTFSAENDPRCECPKAVYELEDYSTRPVNYVRTDRKDIIGSLMKTMLQLALGTSPSKYWGQLFQMGLDQIAQKHVVAYFIDEEAQKAVEAFNMAGRVMTKDETAPVLKYKEADGWDYLHVNHANMAGQKANMFVTEKFTKEVTLNDNGTITTKLVIDYKNPFEGSDCNLERGGLCLNAPLRNWVRVYVPKGSTLSSSKGSQSPKTGDPEEMKSYESLEKTVFEGFLIVNPKGIAKLELTYTSPVSAQNGYKLLVQKQAGTADQEFTVIAGGKEKKFTLNTDTEIVY